MNLTPIRTLILLNTIAFFGLASLWMDETGHIKNTSWVAPQPSKMTAVGGIVKAPSNADPATFASVLERPLFSPDRRHAPVVTSVTQTIADSLDGASLVGLYAGSSGGALVRVDDKTRYVGLGKKLGDWVLQTLNDREAVFVKGDQKRQLLLVYSRLGQPSMTQQAVSNAQKGIEKPVMLADPMRRQLSEEEERNRKLAEIRARMEQKKP